VGRKFVRHVAEVRDSTQSKKDVRCITRSFGFPSVLSAAQKLGSVYPICENTIFLNTFQS